ncbi:hydroxymethylbilane synthase [Demequina sp.]|uniref:hydroxymethylbilane synthase n=1 Tax=Demequina sp. TaxID=2050685 RepID=UPI003D0B92E6
MHIRLGTRGSALATTQSGMVAESLVAAGARRGLEVDVDLVPITTHGDISRASLVGLSEVGVFVTALRSSLLAGECDLIVHSLKDMPTAPYEGLELAALPEREDVRDALCANGRTLSGLHKGARVGTGSPRRAAQVLALRHDLVTVPIRGNVDTRLAMVGADLDAVVLAAAGLNRLGREAEASELFDPADMLPAPGQGALAVEIADDTPAELAELVRSLDHPATRAAVTAERAALAVLDAGCSAPVGAFATVEDGTLRLTVRVMNTEGTLTLTEKTAGRADDAESLGRAAAHALLGRGAASLMGRG